MNTVTMRSGSVIPALGQGTWNMGEDPARRQAEIGALQLGMDLGLGLIDTAEMYGEGGAEEVVGAAIAGRREQAFIVSKVYPHNADRRGVKAACERSLQRLKTDRIDLYLLHWRGAVPLSETLDAFQALRKEGKILDFGVSNFDMGDMLEAEALPGGRGIALNQVLFNLVKRGIEWDLLPWSRKQGMPVMAYSPLESAGRERDRLLANPALVAVAQRHGCTPAQVALAWLLRQEGVVAIPKAADPAHVRDNRAAAEVALTAFDLEDLDRAFPPPAKRQPLAMR
ncbi:aldo/keto reductase [Massilia atriviolacea]|uniref:Aldo/keto reductase n=1 Tax=Massilia atriviolacea TaxID=2495579 RepID=A0A430HID0_9BURK|nr:aldo/keto reductase [Massilia atriviolacea]RSZ57259.1 aldo/keto reductase [Massilia atriviolacea]